MIGYIYDFIVIIILLGHITVMGIRLFLSSLPRTYTDGQFGDFMEGIQFFLIALKYFHLINISWGWTLIIYSLFIQFVVGIGIFCSFLIPIMLGIARCFAPDSNDRKVFMFTSWIFFHISWKGLSFYYLFHNFKIFLYQNGLRPGTQMFSPDPTMIPMMFFFFFGGIINFFWFYQQEELFNRLIAVKLMVISKNKGIKREIIEVPFDMKIVQAGTNYFKKLISTRKIPKTFDLPDSLPNKDNEIPECMICCSNESNILIRPCNHGGICESCIITYLGTNNSCPNCKAKITKIYVMDFNKDMKKYYGTKVLTIVD
jgi:hypothetical protein